MAVCVFLAAACLVWLPFDAQHSVYKTRSDGRWPAGEITREFRLFQRVTPDTSGNAVADRVPRRQCFGLRFATYARVNKSRIDVRWRQAGRRQQWRIEAADLDDNAYRYFCPAHAFDSSLPFDLEIMGVDGEPGQSATVWLAPDTRLGRAKQGTRKMRPKRALALDVSSLVHVDVHSALTLNRYAFLFAWLCSVLSGTLMLLFAFRPLPPPAGPTIDGKKAITRNSALPHDVD